MYGWPGHGTAHCIIALIHRALILSVVAWGLGVYGVYTLQLGTWDLERNLELEQRDHNLRKVVGLVHEVVLPVFERVGAGESPYWTLGKAHQRGEAGVAMDATLRK